MDNHVYSVKGLNMTKDCTICQHAPAISLVVIDFIGAMNGLVANVYWYGFEVLFTLLYLRHATSKTDLYSTNEQGHIQLKPQGILSLVMVGIAIRTLIICSSSSLGCVPQG